MSLEQVQRILHARSVAIYGASDDTNKWGGGLMHLLRRHGWPGRIYPINRHHGSVQGHTAYPDIASIPDSVDVACVAVPADTIGQVIGECADKGVAGCLVISSNFAETGAEGERRQQDIVEVARQRGTRLIGPNCMGLMNTHERFNLCNSSATEYYDHLPQGAIGVASQSGALMGTMLARAYDCGVGLSSGISVGNQADLEICDFFEYLIADPHTRIICLYIEGLRSPERFRTLCQRSIASGKPVLLVKAGRSASGAHAVQSHTGSLAGAYQSLAAVCEQLGVQLMEDVVEMVDAAIGWVTMGGWQGGGVAVATASGGGGALAMDVLEDTGLEVPRLGETCQSRLAPWLPLTHLQLPLDAGVLASHGSPTHMRQGMTECMSAIMADPGVGAGLYVMTTQKYAEACTQALVDTIRSCGKPLLLVNQASEVGQAQGQMMRANGLLQCTSVRSAITVLKTLRNIGRVMENRPAADVLPGPSPEVMAWLGPARSTPETLSEAATKALLAQAGLPVPGQGLAHNAAEAVRIAQELGWPVVLKIEADGVTHKSDIGGVAVNLANAQAVEQAYARLMESVSRHIPRAAVRGCLVQQSVPADVELIVGTRWDEQFGTMLLVGIGGTLVELLHDVRLMPAPARAAEVRTQLEKLQLLPLLTGYRGAPAADMDKVVAFIQAVGDFAAALGDRLLEFDVNPVRIAGARISIADARAVVR